MKIGILTYHQSHNYGALLQAVALRKVLEDMGHEVYYINYYPDYHRELYRIFSWKVFRSRGKRDKLRYLKNYLKTYSFKKRRYNKFVAFKKKFIYPYCKPLKESYDVVVYGSDQIWRKQPGLNDFNPIYFGQNDIKTKMHVSYAASMGSIAYAEEDKEKFKKLVSHLDKISVREKNLHDFLIFNGFPKTELVLDPTLLLLPEHWNKIIPPKNIIKEKYCLFYNLQKGAFNDKEVQEFAQKHKLKLIVLYGYAYNKGNDTQRMIDGPVEFMHLIREASFIFTSSYHGLMFSLCFGKPFYASFIKNEDRARSILTDFELERYLLRPNSQIPEYSNYESSLLVKKLETERIKSIKYILN